MFIYYGKRYNSASIGARLATVACERCGCEYYYELARVGSGAASAPYGIGADRASRSSGNQARADLDRRLAEDAELVPCPKCRWVNEDLIARYRQGRCRGWAKGAGILALLGTILSGIVAWFVSIGPATDRGAALMILIAGPAISIGLAGSILLIRGVLRARIRPNREDPMGPRIPPGTPPALLRNPSTSVLEPAVKGAGGEAGPWMEFQVGRSGLPTACCECLAPPEIQAAYRRPLQPAVELIVPLCGPCAGRWKRRKWLGALASLGLVAVAGLMLLALKADEATFWLSIIGLGIVVPIMGLMVADRLTAPVRVRIVDAPRGVVRLWFRNDGYPRLAR